MATFQFLDLPAELRIQIYRELLVVKAATETLINEIDTAILRTCKQLKQEGEDVLYSGNEVHIDVSVQRDTISTKARVPGMFCREKISQPVQWRKIVVGCPISTGGRDLGPVLHVFSARLARFRRFHINIAVEDRESRRQQQKTRLQAYLVASVLTQTSARAVTVTLEDGPRRTKLINALLPLAALRVQLAFKGVSAEDLTRLLKLAYDARIIDGVIKNVATEWFNTEMDATAFLNKIGPRQERLFNIDSVARIRGEVYDSKITDQELGSATRNLKHLLVNWKGRMMDAQEMEARVLALPRRLRVKSPPRLRCGLREYRCGKQKERTAQAAAGGGK